MKLLSGIRIQQIKWIGYLWTVGSATLFFLLLSIPVRQFTPSLYISEEDKWVALLKRGEQGPAAGGSARDRLPRYADSRRVLDIDRRAEDPRRHDDNWRVEEARRLDDARRAEEARRAEDARRLEESRRVEDQRRLDHAKRFEEPRRWLFNTLSSVQNKNFFYFLHTRYRRYVAIEIYIICLAVPDPKEIETK